MERLGSRKIMQDPQSETMKYCPHCGLELLLANPCCHTCGANLNPEWSFCATCGAEAEGSAEPELTTNNSSKSDWSNFSARILNSHHDWIIKQAKKSGTSRREWIEGWLFKRLSECSLPRPMLVDPTQPSSKKSYELFRSTSDILTEAARSMGCSKADLFRAIVSEAMETCNQ